MLSGASAEALRWQTEHGKSESALTALVRLRARRATVTASGRCPFASELRALADEQSRGWLIRRE